MPAAAVKRGERVLFRMIGRKGHVGGIISEKKKTNASHWKRFSDCYARVKLKKMEFLEEG